MDLFHDKSASESDEDTTDSEESVYSGLEEEPDTSDDEEGKKDDKSDSEDEDNSESDNEESDKENEIDNDTEDKDVNEEDTNTVNVAAKNKYNEKNNTRTTSQTVDDEYYHDSSDEEDIRNTVGNIPMEWYRDYPHIGYDVEGRKLIKPKKGDELDEFLQRMDNPDYWRTVTNKMTGQNVLLTKEDVSLIEGLMLQRTPGGAKETYEPWIDFFTHETMIHPVTNRPADKRSFIPSKWEKLKVGQMVHAIKMGWMKRSRDKKEKEDDDEPKYFMLWKDDEENEVTRRYRANIPAPKAALPGHVESYNPPPEYLFTKEEEEQWLAQEPEERRMNFIPKKYDSLRLVPAYSRFVKERFERCLDLYLCPRQQQTRMNINPEDLIPRLPKPKDLQPFPTQQAIIYKGHTDIVRCISADPTGQWLASGCDDETVKFWEVLTGRCMKTLKVSGTPRCIAWNPNPAICLCLVAVDQNLLVLNPGLGDKVLISNTDSMIQNVETTESAGKSPPLNWTVCEDEQYDEGYRFILSHPKEITHVSWHGKGDYFASVMPKADSKAVLIHQLSKQRSQNPFSKPKGLVQCVYFHPVRPFLFVATQRYIRVYNLLKQELTKKLMTSCRWVSSMSIHSGGDNLVIGSYDCKLTWFDLDLSTKPYQTLRHHKKAIRQVSFHKRYPLFASASDDGTVIVCHGMVYNDLLQNPLIVPVKVLHGHKITKDLGVIDCEFHPTQPWVFSSGADGTIRLYT
ncbi:ribosome biogenesis protein bop1-like [Mytilus californianus]|uniref:ribosome biogenesis protein bop1-like n=1 Tax=Mytilus californianus TaxID=6549 RepID=UPI00224842F0|nr:ribosome biogenesis protein bop1-like [Mytilus californianus]